MSGDYRPVRRAAEVVVAEWDAYIGDESEGHDDVVRMGEAVGRLREALRVVR